MKHFIKIVTFLLAFSGVVFINQPTLAAKVLSQNNLEVREQVLIDYMNTFYKNGKDHIQSPAPGSFITMVYENFEKDGEYILYNKDVISLYKSPNGSKSGAISPQVVTSKKRIGQWFLIDSYLGPRWIYNDKNIVELRDLFEKKAKLILNEKVNIHSKPFSAFKTNRTIEPTPVNVIKQAGSWYLIDYDNSNVWITTENAKFEGTISTFNTSNIYGIPYKKMIIPTGNKSVRPEYPLKPDFITVHNTANTQPGANAEMHGKYLLNQASSNPESWVSWHFTVDDKQIVQHLPLDEAGFHAGDNGGPGNRSSIGIEITENIDGNYEKAEENAKKLIAYLMHELKIPLENVKGHIHWSGKYCPRVILNNGWNKFKNSLKQVYDSVTPKPLVPRIVTGGFLGVNNVKKALDNLRSETGWWATYEQTGQSIAYYQIVSGNFLGENKATEALREIQSETGWWMTIEKTSPAYYTYDIVTGAFKGLENVKKATEDLRRETGWWARYEATETPGYYRILTGGFAGEKNIKNALNYIKETRGWWIKAVPRKNPVYYYRIVSGDILGENNAKRGLAHFHDKNWWATYQPTGRTEKYYRIVTGGFASMVGAEENAQMIRDKFGWWVTVEMF